MNENEHIYHIFIAPTSDIYIYMLNYNDRIRTFDPSPPFPDAGQQLSLYYKAIVVRIIYKATKSMTKMIFSMSKELKMWSVNLWAFSQCPAFHSSTKEVAGSITPPTPLRPGQKINERIEK